MNNVFSILAELDPADERLLEEDLAPQADQKRFIASTSTLCLAVTYFVCKTCRIYMKILFLFRHRQHTKTVSWLRKTEYISTEYNRFQTSNEMAETK